MATSPTSFRLTSGSSYEGVTLKYSVENEPLDSGGGIAFAARGLESSFFALNGDSLREADLGAMVQFHRANGAKATILLTPVADPSRYGLVRTAPDGRVETFLEKPRPEEIDTDLINAGLYVLEPEVLDLVPPDHAGFDRAGGLPAARGRGLRLWDRTTRLLAGRRHSRVLPPGAPGRPRADLPDAGRRRARGRTSRSSTSPLTFIPARSWFLPSTSGRARSSRTARGSGAWPCSEQERGSRLAASSRTPSSGPRTSVGAGTSVVGSIVGDEAELGVGCELHNLAVVGPGASVGDGNVLDHGLRIGAGQRIPDGALRFS